MIKTDKMRSHPDFCSEIRDDKDRKAIKEAWDRGWFSLKSESQVRNDLELIELRAYKLRQIDLEAEVKLARELVRLKSELGENPSSN